MIAWEEIDFKGKTKGQVKVDTALSIDLDKGVGKCHYCEEITIRDFKNKQESKKFDLPPSNWTNYTNVSDKVLGFLEARKISQKTIIECKVTEEMYYQPALKKEVANIVFNYFEGDTLVNKKYRSADKKFTQSKNTKNIFYGINDIIGEKECYIVEGEFDKLALWEVGKKNCISVPNGANDNDDVWQACEQYLASIEKFYICTDMDAKGTEIAEKIAQRLGRYRCERITFKNKDANDDLIESVFTLENSLNNPKKYPVSGTFKVEDLESDIYKLYDSGLPETIYPKGSWFDGMKDMFSVMRGHLVTVTGIPSHGKSNFTDWYVLNLLEDHNMKASWFSPEHHPLELHQSNLMQKFFGKPFFNSIDGVERITRPEIQQYKKTGLMKRYI
jgi:twinkle protein